MDDKEIALLSQSYRRLKKNFGDDASIVAINNKVSENAGVSKRKVSVSEDMSMRNSWETVLITTFTQENEAEIRQKFIQKYGSVPRHIVIQTWFSFLLQHGVRPYQGRCHQNLFEKKINGIVLVNEQSGVKYRRNDTKKTPVLYKEETEFDKCYFNVDMKLFTDKLARFVVRANKNSKGDVIDRISRIYPTIFVDEVQDLAGYDLEILRLLFHSRSTVFCVGDPRQVTYYTHWERMNNSYRNGKIIKYVNEKCYKSDKIIVDERTLAFSHRNNQHICDFSSKIYPSQPKPQPCKCLNCHTATLEHQGVFIVRSSDLDVYMSRYTPVQLRHNILTPTKRGYSSLNFGQSKGKTYNRVIIYPTDDMKNWLKDTRAHLADETRAKLYVAVTRAKYSAAFVLPDDECESIKIIELWNCSES